jgi:hypothetical protein
MSRKFAGPSHHARDTIGQYLNPENGYRGALEKRGIQPKNHMKDNMKDIRLTEMRNRQKKDDESRPAKPLYKLPQFQNIETRVYDSAPGKENSPRRRSDEDENPPQFLSRGQSELRREELAREKRAIRDQLERKMEEERQFAESADGSRKAAVPRSNDLAIIKGPSNADFINRNKVQAITMLPKSRPQEERDYKHDEFGRLPKYLEERKNQWAEEEEAKRRRRPDPDCPPGMVLMPESERVSTLEVLQQSHEEAMNQMRKLPFVIETPSMRKKQEFLEGKLREIEHAISIFSKPKVYVSLDR